MASALFGIATGALNSARIGLQTASHNISNANTPGYARQSAVQTTNNPLFTGAGFLGQGVRVSTVQRQYSGFLETQMQASQSRLSQLDSWHSQLSQIDNLLADPTAGLTPALNDFFQGVQTLSQYPGDTSARQGMLSSAAALAGRFQSLNSRFDQMQQETNGRIAVSVEAINGYTTQIAELNDRIRLASADPLIAPNDLLDQRDTLLQALNKEVQATTVMQSDGSVNVFFGNGQPAVVGTRAYSLRAEADPADPMSTRVGLETLNGVVPFTPADLGGGALSGLLSFRDVSLSEAANSLGRVAMTLATQFNDQHSAGMDLNGALGGTFFTFTGPQTFSYSSNAGTGVMTASVTSLSALGNSDYRVNYDGSGYTITRLADNQVQSFATLPQTVDGISFSLSGTPAPGDGFLVQPTRAGARDLALAISDLARIAAATPVKGSNAKTNIGSGALGPVTVSTPPDPNLTQTVTLTFNADGTFNVNGTGTGNPTNLAFTSGATLSFNGWSVALNGTPRPGDTFTLSANTGAPGDNGNALALTGLQTQKTLMGGRATFGEGYATLVASVGNKTRELDAGAEAQIRLVDDAIAARESLSGVSLDEEAANLLRYQQAYQAAGRIIQVADQMFSTIINLGA